MERTALTQMVKWKKSTDRKPLVLKGARQVGKTWMYFILTLMKRMN